MITIGKENKIPLFDHFLVPKHEILKEEEVKELLDKYKISKEQLPKILITDPAVKHLNAKIGDIIRIERESETAGKYYYYRVVVSNDKNLEDIEREEEFEENSSDEE